ncbi:MAG: CBU_0585 family protein [Legionella sp.]|nr:CBU_0585 family protein [Legionella sp.]
MNDDIDKFFVSPYDKFLFEFDATHAKSLSQLKEIEKNRRIALMRDNKDYKSDKGEIWEEF